jgi:cytochrome c553
MGKTSWRQTLRLRTMARQVRNRIIGRWHMGRVHGSGRWSGIAMLVLSLALACEGPATAQERVPELIHRARTVMPDAHRGRQVYAAQCARCHSADGGGSHTKAIPVLATQHPAYLVEQMAAFAEFARDDSSVHRLLADTLSRPQTLADVAAYLGALPPVKQARGRRKADAGALSKGKALYLASCAGCHGLAADGDAEHFVPALHGQHSSYLLVQLRRIAHGHRRDALEEFVEELGRMSSADMEAVALYLASLPPG